MKNTPRLVIPAVVWCLAVSAHAATAVWTNGGGNNLYTNSANWSTGSFPASADIVEIRNTSQTGAMIVNANAPNEHGQLRTSQDGPVTINITGGTLNGGSTTGSLHIYGVTYDCTVNNTGGIDRHGNSGGLAIGSGVCTVSYTLDGSSAVLDCTRGNLRIPDLDNATTAVFTVKNGGSFYIRENKLMGVNKALRLGNTNASGTAKLSIQGTGGSRWVGRTTANQSGGDYYQHANGTLEVGIGSGAGITGITVYDSSTSPGTAGNVTFEAGARLDVLALAGAVDGTYVVMTWQGSVTDNGLTLGTAPAGTTFNVSATGKQLTVTLTGLSGDTTAPAAPTGLASQAGNCIVSLNWANNTEGDLAGYNVRRSTTSGGPYTTIATGTPGSAYTDRTVANNTTYYYVVSAVDTSSNESSNSSQISASPNGVSFIHPGALHTQEDLDRMARKVAIGAEPWTSGWNVLTANSHAQLTWTPNPAPIIYRGFDGVHAENYSQLFNDTAAAFQCALRYHVSGNSAYADKAAAILDAWSSTLMEISGTSDKYLAAGLYGYQFAAAGELLLNYSGWNTAGKTAFKNMMLNIFYPMNHDFLANHNYSCISHYWANWDLCNIASMAVIGVLCDNRSIYDEALLYYEIGEGNGAIGKAVYYIHPDGLGQQQESGRDQGHTMLGIGLMGVICEAAWNQGEDFYAYGGNRMLSCAEYVAKYNLGNSVSYVTYNNCDNVNQTVISSVSRGETTHAAWEHLYNHAVNIKGLSAPYAQQYAALMYPEGGGGNYGSTSGGYDLLGFGTLRYTRDPSGVTPPAKPAAPAGLNASGNPCGVSLTWTASPGATAYNVMRSTVSGGPYTTTLALEVPGTSYTDSTAPIGETFYYTVSATNDGGESGRSTQAVALSGASPLSAPWSNQDIGTVGLAGSAAVCASLGEYTIRGAGSNVGGTVDSFHFAYVNMSGDGELIARMRSVEIGGISDDKMGLMIRETTAANARNYSLLLDANVQWNARTQYRASVGGNTSSGASGPSVYPPEWLRIVRSGSTFTSYYSENGAAWTLIGSSSVTMTSDVLAGLFVCSRNTDALNTSVFDNVTMPGGDITPPAAPTGLVATAGDGSVSLDWTDNTEPDLMHYDVYRSTTSGSGYVPIYSGVSVSNYVDNGVTNGTTYYYVVTAVDTSSNESGYSNQASATPTAAPPTFVSAGAIASGTGTIAPALPSAISAGDVLLLFIETANQTVSISNQNGGTWSTVTSSPQGTGTAGGTSATRLTVFWSRYNGSQGAPTVSDSGNHQIARMIAVRGAAASGNPWNVTAGGVETASDTSCSIPGATTTVANTLVVVAVAGSLPDATGTANFSAWTNANLTSLTERTDNTASAGNGGALGIATGIKASAGTYGNTAVTHASAAVKGMISIAIRK